MFIIKKNFPQGKTSHFEVQNSSYSWKDQHEMFILQYKKSEVVPSVHFPEKQIQTTLSPPAPPYTQPELLRTENQGLDVQDNSSGYQHNICVTNITSVLQFRSGTLHPTVME